MRYECAFTRVITLFLPEGSGDFSRIRESNDVVTNSMRYELKLFYGTSAQNLTQYSLEPIVVKA